MILSVIIPVYNAEKYLPRLFDSIRAQTLKDAEFSIVNDGSTDGSDQLIKDFIKDNPDIKVIYHTIPNSGQGAARELAVNSSTGEYVCFVDADDYIEPNFVETFVEIINQYHPDMVSTNYYINDDQEHPNPFHNDKLLELDEIKEKIYPFLIHNDHYEYFIRGMMTKAVKREMYIDNICKDDIRIGEDIAVFIPIMAKCQNMYLSSRYLYHYMMIEGSMIHVKKPRNFDDVIRIYNHLKNKIPSNLFEEFNLQTDRWIAHLAFNCAVTQFYSDKPYKEICEIIDKNLDNEIITRAIKNIDAKGMKPKMMRYALKHRSYRLMKMYSKVMK